MVPIGYCKSLRVVHCVGKVRTDLLSPMIMDLHLVIQPDFSNPQSLPSSTQSSQTFPSEGSSNPQGFARYLTFMRRNRPRTRSTRTEGGGSNNTSGRQSQLGRGDDVETPVGRRRMREADQSGPGGY